MSGATPAGRHRTGVVLGVASGLLVALLAILAVELDHSQVRARRDVEQRFVDRAHVSATLTESLFSSAFRTAHAFNARLYGSQRVSRRALDASTRATSVVFSVLLARGGHVIATSSGTPPAALGAALGLVRRDLPGKSFFVDGEQALGPQLRVVISAQSIATPFGRRVLVTGTPAKLMYQFLGGYIRELPTMAGGQAYVIDDHGVVLGSTTRAVVPGRRLSDGRLLTAVARRASGRVAGGRYFASYPVAGSSWRVVMTAPVAELFASVSGADRWLPWLALAAFAIAGIVALVLLRGTIRNSARLRIANRELEGSLGRLADSEERLRFLIDGAVDYAICMLDPDGRVTSWNHGAERQTGYSAEEIIGRPCSMLYPASDIAAGLPAAALAAAAREGRYESEGWRVRKDRTRFWANVVTAAVRGPDGELRGFAKVTRDVTDRKRAEEQLVHDAMHDALTGLPNRCLFVDRLSQALSRAERHPDYRCAVLFLDLDRFKLVNDSLTHEVGDELLVAFAGRLSACLRPGDTVARLGGDEFTILVDDIGTADEAAAVAGRVQRALESPFRIRGRDLVLSASVGIAVSGHGMTAAELMRNADIAMYDAKRRGRARSAAFNAGMHSRLVNRLQLETDLRAAIAGRRLRVFYQPIIELASGRLKGFEALVRWPVDDPAIEPAEFVAVAEETGLIGRLGSLVLEDACGRLAEWRERGLVDPDVTVSVNVSRRQLGDAQLIADIEAALGRAGLPPQALCLEITETAIMDEPERMQAALAAIARIGVRAQVDDFGMGYSSLAFLRRFPGDTVKIDRSYIASMDQEEGSEAIVRAIIELARNLGVHTIAEGIEHAAQRDMLLALGCDYAQGFLFSKPVPGDAVESLIRSWAASPVR